MNSDYQNQKTYYDVDSGFSSAALYMGIFAIISVTTIIFPIVFGALGILFAILSKRRNRRLPSHAFYGVTTSIIGIFFGIVLFTTALPQAINDLKDPIERQKINNDYLYKFGISFDDMMEQSGIDVDELLENY